MAKEVLLSMTGFAFTLISLHFNSGNFNIMIYLFDKEKGQLLTEFVLQSPKIDLNRFVKFANLSF